MPSPKGSIDIPEPTVKKLIPSTKRIVPNKNKTRIPAARDTQVTERIRTIIAIGKTETSDSLIDAKMCAIYKCSYIKVVCKHI